MPKLPKESTLNAPEPPGGLALGLVQPKTNPATTQEEKTKDATLPQNNGRLKNLLMI